ncbi:MAG: hypothetical protein ABIP90_10835 [Vicinamibacterales bacterium]
MRAVYVSVAALAVTLAVTSAIQAQATPAQAPAMQDADRKVVGGGITAPGWQGRADGAGKVEEAKLTFAAGKYTIMTGPAISYWNPANVAKGDYTVKATFNEPNYMNLNDHPHPYGIFIGGNDLGTPDASLMYCAPYGSGTVIIRGFSGTAPDGKAVTFRMNGGRGAPAESVHKAEKGQPVTQEVMWTVKGGRAECSINGAVVGGYTAAEVVGAGKLKSLDGVYGIRASHNVEVIVSGLEKK